MRRKTIIQIWAYSQSPAGLKENLAKMRRKSTCPVEASDNLTCSIRQDDAIDCAINDHRWFSRSLIASLVAVALLPLQREWPEFQDS